MLAAWAALDQQAADLVAETCGDVLAEPPPGGVAPAAAAFRAGVDRGGWPYDYFRNACGWRDGVLGDEDLTVWLTGVASTIAPMEDPGTDGEEQAAVGALDHADWVALTLGVVRRGVGAPFSANSWHDDSVGQPEIDTDEFFEDDPDTYVMPVEVLAPLWQALGVIDEDRRFTEAGRWGMPAALLAVHVPLTRRAGNGQARVTAPPARGRG